MWHISVCLIFAFTFIHSKAIIFKLYSHFSASLCDLHIYLCGSLSFGSADVRNTVRFAYKSDGALSYHEVKIGSKAWFKFCTWHQLQPKSGVSLQTRARHWTSPYSRQLASRPELRHLVNTCTALRCSSIHLQ